MKDNRRDFLKKSASIAAGASLAGLAGCTGTIDNKVIQPSQDTAEKDIEWPFTFGDDKPKMCLMSSLDRTYMRKIKQIGVNHLLCG